MNYFCGVIFMISWQSGFETLCRGLMSFHDAWMLCLQDFVSLSVLACCILQLI